MSLAPKKLPNSICQDVDEIGKRLEGVRLTFDEKWELALTNSSRFNNFSDSSLLGGFSGVWKYYKGSTAAADQLESTYRALRCYSISEDKQVLEWHHFHEKPFPNGFAEPVPRKQDGLYDTSVSKRMDDPYFSCSMVLTDEELDAGRQACFSWRCIPLPCDFIMRIAVSLPPGNMAAPRVTPHDGLNDSLSFVNSKWGLEAFLDDTLHRWTMGPIYDSQTLRLISNFQTMELYIRIRPSEPIHLDAMPFPELRPALHADPEKWLEHGDWEGTMSEVIWDDDGEMLRLRTRPAIWTPPDPHSKDHRLIRYEDAMYGFYPTTLPSFNKQDQLPTYKNVVRFEIGGLMRAVDEFRRVLLRYKVNGTAESLAVEWYHRVPKS
ncbi:hypothetical protein WJX74_007859 [Apatococcus lobatus]|uniref:Uncharacterized protein n=1 Tax=Apatococcus lobatus TaxID=904363 RepID=A0AAW1QCE0_9CHLO